MKKSLYIYTFIVAMFLTMAIFTSSIREETPKQQISVIENNDAEPLPQVIKPVNLDKEFSFAGESIPMENFDVKERLDREFLKNAYWHSSTILNIKRASRYFPVIEKILEENDIPDDFKYLAVAESNLSNARSPAGAKGFWQFLKKTGQAHGLEINSEIDERYHLEKATKAACKVLKKYKKRFGSWTLAAAAYNIGETKLSKIVKNQRAKTYYDLNITDETSRYIFRILAFKEILQNPENFGFYLSEKDLYKPLDKYSIVEVKKPIKNLGDFAAKYGISYRTLKIYNPWLRSYKLTNKAKKTYLIKIPE